MIEANKIIQNCTHTQELILTKFERRIASLIDEDHGDVQEFLDLDGWMLLSHLDVWLLTAMNFLAVLDEMSRVVKNCHELYISLYWS